MKLIYIRDSKSKGYLALGFYDGENKYSLTVSESEHRRIGAHLSGDSISPEEFSEYRRADEIYRAKKRARNILSYGDNSERMLKIKLFRAGFSKDVIEDTAEEMKRLGYVEDFRQLLSVIERLVNIQNIGPLKIVPKLIAKGYKKEKIEAAIDELMQNGIIDFSEAKRRLIEKKLPEGADENAKKQLLYKSGFQVC